MDVVSGMTISRSEAIYQFASVLRQHGLIVSEVKANSDKVQRCQIKGKKRANRSGAYKLFVSDHGAVGWLQDWSCNERPIEWHYQNPNWHPTPQQERELQRERERLRAELEQQRAQEREDARDKATSMWRAAEAAADTFPYCERKKVEPRELKTYQYRNGNEVLLVPLRDEADRLVNLQLIHQDGRKNGLVGGPQAAVHFWIAHPDDVHKPVICICEGWATGETIHQATGYAVVMALNAGNLLAVAKWLRERYPDHKIILCADDDWKTKDRNGKPFNPGLNKATAAARAIGGLLAVPKFPPSLFANRNDDDSDFNDVYVASNNLNLVEQQIEAASEAPAEHDEAEPDVDADLESRTLPIIQVVDGQIARIVDEAQHALIAAGLPIFVRGKMLVEPNTVEREAADGRQTKTTIFSPISEEKIIYLLNKQAAMFQRFDSRRSSWVVTNPPSKVAKTLLSLKSWKFPEVVGIVGAPTMRFDGSILSKPGYDPTSRLWCDATFNLPAIQERPTRQDAINALQLYKELLKGFPFVGAVDLAVALAAIMTVVLRGAFELTPMFLTTAHDVGNGKSYFNDVLSTIVNGRACPVIAAGESEEEMNKRLGSILLEGGSMVSLDNLSFDLQSDQLCQILSQTIVKTRILGQSATPECEWRGTMLATGNNIRVLGDLVRRTFSCNLDAGVERPELRKFAFDPIARVFSDRGAYITAAITIARAYQAVGEANYTVTPLAGYGKWSSLVREPLLWLGEHDPIVSMEAARTADPERAATHELIKYWKVRFGIDEEVTVRDIVATANKLTESMKQSYPRFRGLLLEHAGTPKQNEIDPKRLGHWLEKQHGRVYAGMRIDLIRHKGKANGYVLREMQSGG